MASFERKTKGLLRIIHSDGSFKNRMFYNRISKAIGRVKIPKDLLCDEKFEELIDKINSLVIMDSVFMLGYRTTTGYTLGALHVYCYSEIDLMALKLGLYDG